MTQDEFETEAAPTGYERVVIKMSGEALGSYSGTLDVKRMTAIAQAIASIHASGVSIILVVGGGNIFRGKNGAEWQLDRREADNVGMLATGINAMLLAGLLRHEGVSTRILSRGPCAGIGDVYRQELALEALDELGELVMIAGGMGISGVSTDYPAVRDAIEMRADAVIMAKHGVDGVYDADPRYDSSARFLRTVTASHALAEKLDVMDYRALALARDCKKYIHVVPAEEPDSVKDVVEGKEVGSTILPW